jgi:hypothetical protein
MASKCARRPTRPRRLADITVKLTTPSCDRHVVAGGYRAGPESFPAITRLANSTKVLRFKTPARLYLYDTLL